MAFDNGEIVHGNDIIVGVPAVDGGALVHEGIVVEGGQVECDGTIDHDGNPCQREAGRMQGSCPPRETG